MGASPGLEGALIGSLLRGLSYGDLVIEWPDGSEQEFSGVEEGISARLVVKDKSAIRRALAGGSIGFAEGYMRGEWDTPDLSALLELGNTNIERIGRHKLASPRRPLLRALHAMRANGPSRARRNIAYHYDLGNDFYRLWLDDTMTYSSALFAGDSPRPDLGEAQRRKWDQLLNLLQPGSNDHLLEIGCGWGGFALHAAKEAGCKVTGITLSQEQHDFASARVAEEGLEGRVDIRIQDYREVDQKFTGIASIEMFEAVGQKYWPVFFGKVSDLLEHGRRAAIQTITIREESFEEYRTNPDFIQRYIFPGGMLPSPERFRHAASERGLCVSEPSFFGESYATTLEAWLARFDDVRDQVIGLGFDERFVRMWRYYLAYCRAGFRSNNVDVMHVTLER